MPEPRLPPDPVDLFSDLLRAMVDDPEALEISAIPDPDGIVIRVRAAQGDMGKVIGVEGRSARALRTLLMAVSSSSGRRYMLEIVRT